MNVGNLKTPSAEEAREKGGKGGRASGKSRRNKKAMQDAWNAIRNIPLKAGEVADLEAIRSVAELNGANITIEQAAVIAIAKKAMRGDVGAFDVLAKLTESRRKAEELTAKKAKLEVEKLRVEVKAYQRAVDTVEVGVMIIDNIQ